jgi:hypothetical protein
VNLSQMVTLVRTQTDADIDDAPDILLEMFARQAYNDIRERVYPWPDKFEEYELTTAPDVPSYLFADLVPDGLQYLVSMYGRTQRITYIPWQTYVDLKEGTGIRQSTTEADYFTVRNDKIYLWPTPSEVVTYTVHGYRRFKEWPAGSDSPDLPRQFDDAIVMWMTAQYHRSQEDVELAAMYQGEYERTVNRFIGGVMRESSATAGPRVFGGDYRSPLTKGAWLRRNVENQ